MRCSVFTVAASIIGLYYRSKGDLSDDVLHPEIETEHRSVPGIHHPDQGVQYLSDAYTSPLARHSIEISVAQSRCTWENRYAERLIRTLEKEEVHLNAYKDSHEAREHIEHFLTQVCIRLDWS